MIWQYPLVPLAFLLQYFGELMMMSGLVLTDEVKWISFHGSYDFAYLLKTLTCCELPLGLKLA